LANEERLFQILKFALQHVVADFKMRDALMLGIQNEEESTRQLEHMTREEVTADGGSASATKASGQVQFS
jgi:hypothetical protein